MKNMKKSMKIVLVSVISFVCVLSIALGAFFALRPKSNPEQPLTWAEKVDLLGQELRQANMSKNEVQVLEKGLVFEDHYDKEKETLIEANENYFVTKDPLTEDKSVYIYAKNLADNSLNIVNVKDKVSEGGYADENVNSSSIVGYNSKYVIMQDLVGFIENETYSLLKLIDVETGKIVISHHLERIDDKEPMLANFYFTDNGKSAVFATSISIDGNSSKYSVYYVDFELAKISHLITYVHNYGEHSEDKTPSKDIYGNGDVIYSRIFNNGYVIAINTKVYAYIIENGKVYTNSFDFDESKVFSEAWKLPTNQIIVEIKEIVKSNNVIDTSVVDVDFGGDPVYFNYHYNVISLKGSKCEVTKLALEEGVSKIEFEVASNSFYFTREYGVNSENVLSDESVVKYYFKDKGLIFEFETENRYEEILNADGGKILTKSGILNFTDASTFEYIQEFSSNTGIISTDSTNGDIYIATYGSNNKYTLGYYSLEFENEFEGVELVYGEDKTEFVLKNVYSDGENYIFASVGKFFRFDKVTKEFILIDNFYFDDKTFDYLLMNGVSLYPTKEHDNTFNLYDMSGKLLFDNITEYEFVDGVESGIILKIVSNSNTYNIALDVNFGMIAVEDYIKRMSELDNEVSPYSSTNQVAPYWGTMTVIYYYSYWDTKSYTYDGHWLTGYSETKAKSFMGSSPGWGWGFVYWSTSSTGTGNNYSVNSTIWTFGTNTFKLFAVMSRNIVISSLTEPDYYYWWNWTQYMNIWTYTVTSTAPSNYKNYGFNIWSYYGFGINNDPVTNDNDGDNRYWGGVTTDWTGSSSITPWYYSLQYVCKVLYADLNLIHRPYRYKNNDPSQGPYSGSTTASGSTSNDITRRCYMRFDQYYSWGRTQILSASNGYSRWGYLFDEWSYSETDTYSYSRVDQNAYFYPPNYNNLTSSKIYMYGYWTPITYTLRLYNTTGEIEGYGTSVYTDDESRKYTCKEAKFDQEYTINHTKVRREGYQFSGWEHFEEPIYVNASLTSTVSTVEDTTQYFRPSVTFLNLRNKDGSWIGYNAKWTPIKYKIVLREQSGNIFGHAIASGSSGLELSGTTFIATYHQTGKFNVNVQRNGYVFGGWDSSSSKGTLSRTFSVVNNTLNSIQVTTSVLKLSTTHNSTVYLDAVWESIAFYVTIDANGGSLSNFTNPTTVYYHDTERFTNSICKTGYDFDGWEVAGSGRTDNSLSKDAGVYYTLVPESTTPIGVETKKALCTTRYQTINLKAKWKAIEYKILIDGNGGTVEGKDDISGCEYSSGDGLFTLTYNQDAKFFNTIYKMGYLFDGWEVIGASAAVSAITKTASNGNGVEYAIKNQTTSPIDVTTSVRNLTTNKSTITLKAKWQALTYYIQYNKNAPSKATSDITYNGSTTSPVPTTSGLYATESAISDKLYTLKGWTQLGWAYNNPNATEAEYFQGEKYSLILTTVHQSTIVFYAVWTQNIYTVQLLGGTDATISNLIKETDTIFDLNDVNNTFKLRYDDSATFKNNIVKHGYKFNGWKITTDTTGGNVNAKQPSSYLSFADYYDQVRNTETPLPLTTDILNLSETNGYTVKLEAQWTAITYYVQLNENATNATIDYPDDTDVSNLSFSNIYTIKYDDLGTFKVNIKRVGYVFGSWYNRHQQSYGTITPSHDPYIDTTKTILLTTQIKNLTKTSECIVVLDLIWVNITYKVKLLAGADSGVEFQNYIAKNNPYIKRVEGDPTYDFVVTYDYIATFTVNLKRPGYKFKSWKVSNKIGTNTTNPADTSVADDIVTYYDLNRDTAKFFDLQTDVYNLSTTNGELVTLTAEWTAITYIIRYNQNRPGADYIPSTTTVPASTHPVEGIVPNSPAEFDVETSLQMVYYSLIGWSYEGWWFNGTSPVTDSVQAREKTQFASEATGKFNLTYVDKSTVDLYTVWRQNVYKIEYLLEGADEHQAENKFPESAKFDDPAFEVALPTKVGYTFVKFEISPLTTNHLKYYLSVGEDVSSVDPSTEMDTIAAIRTTFINMNTTDCFYRNLSSKDDSTVTFKAYWTKNRYKIEYDYDTSTTSSTEGIPDPSGSYPTTATYDEDFTVTHPIKFGYTFEGWTITDMSTTCPHYFDGVNKGSSTSAAGVKATVFKNLHSENDAVVKFTAMWRPNEYYVEYNYDYPEADKNPGNVHPSTMTFDKWEEVPNAVRTGYTFTGWIITDLTIECDHYYGKTTTDYKTTATEVINIEDVGYVQYKNLHYVDKTTINFKATWIPNRYKISYVVNYTVTHKGESFDLEAVLGSTGMYPTSATYDVPFRVDEPEEAPFGYHFVGWKLENLSDDCKHYYGTNSTDVYNTYTQATSIELANQYDTFMNLDSVMNIELDTTDVVVLRAMWAQNRYYIDYEVEDHRVSKIEFTPTVESVLYNEAFDVPKPKRVGYTFLGWQLDGLSDDTKHYYFLDDGTKVPFTSFENRYVDVENNNPTVYIPVDSTKFMNLHSKDGHKYVRLIAKWKANDYKIRYHYLDASTFNTSIYKDNPSLMNLVGASSPYSKWKDQTVTYDMLFRTMKVSNSDDDPTGVTVPNDISILAWMFFTEEITSSSKFPELNAESGGYRLAKLEGETTVMANKYTLAPGLEYVYSSKVLFEDFDMFGPSDPTKIIHAYAVYGKTNIEIRVMGTDVKGDYNNMAKYYKLNIDFPVSIGQEINLPNITGASAIGYMISSTYYDYGELNQGSITRYSYGGKDYVATVGGKFFWNLTNVDAQNPSKPIFYLYVIYDDAEDTYLQASYDNVNKAIKFETGDKFVNGQKYTISVRGLPEGNYYDYDYIRFGASANRNDTNVLFDKIYSHTGVQTGSVCPSDVTIQKNASTNTILITFTATAATSGYDLYLFYDESLTLSDRFIKDIEINIMTEVPKATS